MGSLWCEMFKGLGGDIFGGFSTWEMCGECLGRFSRVKCLRYFGWRSVVLIIHGEYLVAVSGDFPVSK